MNEEYKTDRDSTKQLHTDLAGIRQEPPHGIPKKNTRIWRWLRGLQMFFFETGGQVYTKPRISMSLCSFILVNIHLNFRVFCRFADHVIDKGPLFVTIVYIAFNAIICPPLCYLYGFLGRYGERSYLTIWDMVPILQGISVSVYLVDCLKILETSILLSSIIMMIVNGCYTDYYMFNGTEPKIGTKIPCNLSDASILKLDYGLTRYFKAIGNTPSEYSFPFDIQPLRIYVLLGLWGTVLAFTMIRGGKYRIFIERFMPIVLLILLSIISFNAIINSEDHDTKYVYTTDGVNAYEYLHVVALVASEFLPSHWVTIGYLIDRDLSRAQVLGTTVLTSLCACIISYVIVFHMQEYAHVINTDPECLTSFGLHFFTVVIPYSIRYRCPKVAATALIFLYFLTIALKAISYMLIHHTLLMCAMTRWKHSIFRSRHMIALVTITVLCGCSCLFCSTNVHAQLLDLHQVAIYHISILVFILTVIGFIIYGPRRIIGDHLFLTGSEYPNIIWLKVLFVFGLWLTLIYMLCINYEFHYLLKMNMRTLVTFVILHAPLVLGVLKTIVMQKKYHRIMLYPLSEWGRADKESRNERRCRNLRHMFITRTSRECNHNCLYKNEVLENEIEEELRFRQILLTTEEENSDDEDNWKLAASSIKLRSRTQLADSQQLTIF